MTTENQPESGPARRTRRATSGVATPAPVEAPAAPAEAPTTDGPARSDAVEPAPSAPEQAPPARRRSRRATAPVGEPGATETVVDRPAEEPTTEPATTEPAPKKRATRKPAAKKPATKKAEPEKAEPEKAEPEKAEPEATGTKPSTRKPATRKSAPKKAAKDAAPEAEAGDLDVVAEEGPARTTTGGAQPRLAATAVLFQAPDLSTARPARRRAQAAAGPPVAPDDELDETDEPAEALTDATEDDEPRATEDAAAESTPDDETPRPRRRRRGGRGRRGRGGPGGGESQDDDSQDDDSDDSQDDADETDASSGEAEESGKPDSGAPRSEGAGADDDDDDSGGSSSSRRRRRRRSRGSRGESEGRTRPQGRPASDEVTALKGSTRLEAKRQRRRDGRDAGRRRQVISEAEFLARRESVERAMVVRERGDKVQIAVVEDGVLVEHFVSRTDQGPSSMVGNVYLGRVQNVLPSMEAAFVDVGRGRNAVLYAGEVNWDAAGLEGQPRRIEQAMKSGDSVLVQVTKEPIGHKGARLTSQVTLAGRYLVYVPGGGMTGISRKLPDTERARLKNLLKEIVPDGAGVIVRTAAEGASEEELRRDVTRLQDSWTAIEKKQRTAKAPAMLLGEPDMAIRVVRDIFNDDFGSLIVQGDGVWTAIRDYVDAMAPDLADRVTRWTDEADVFAEHRIDEQLAKALDRKVWLPSGGSLVIDRTEAMTVVDVNTGKFTGAGGTLEETVTRNNLEAAEEVVRQLRLRDIGGIIVIDFIDMVLELNRDLVLRRLVECLGRDRTKHQVAEVTSLGLVQMTRKRVGQGLHEAFTENCAHCAGRGYLLPTDLGATPAEAPEAPDQPKRSRRKKAVTPAVPVLPEAREAVNATLAQIAAAAAHAHDAAEAEAGLEPEPEAGLEPEPEAAVVTEPEESPEPV